MDFRILGGLEVDDDGERLDTGTAKQQVVLATLLLHRDEPVSGRRLVESVWSDPPSAAGANLRRYLTGLRWSLRPAGENGSRLSSVPGGYRLKVLPGELDLEGFEQLAGRGEQALQQADPLVAVDAFDQALHRWRGRPLDGMEYGPRLESEVTRLEQRRLSVADEWVRVRLELGDLTALAVDLRGLIADYPLRESLWGQLMVTLYRAGRSAEALTAYTEVHELLGSRLGAAPGPELRRIHEQTLRQEPELFADPGRGPSGTLVALGGGRPGRSGADGSEPAGLLPVAGSGPLPRLLPSVVDGFVGRVREREWVARQLRDRAEHGPGPVVVAIDGMAGVGKSALGLQCGHDNADRYPDAQLYVDLQGTATSGTQPAPLHVLARLLSSLGVASRSVPAEEAEAAALFRSTIAGRRVLLVLDDAASTAQVRPLLPGSPGCAVLVTARGVLIGLSESVRMDLGPMPEDEAVMLLAHLVGREQVAADPATARRFVALCGHLPLAIRIATRRLTAAPDRSLAELADRMAANQDRPERPEPADVFIRSSLRQWYQQLNRVDDLAPAENDAVIQTLRIVCSLDATEVDLRQAATALGVADRRAEELLDHLVDVRLLTSPAPGRYRVLEMLRRFVHHDRPARDQDRSGPDRAWSSDADPGCEEGRPVLGDEDPQPVPGR